MLITEWNTEEAKEVWYEEGMEEGLERGREEGREQGLEQGREEGREEIARNALEKGLSIETIHDITGLDINTINKLALKS